MNTLKSFVSTLEEQCSQLQSPTCKGTHSVRITVADRVVSCGFDDDACEEFKERMQLFVAMKVNVFRNSDPLADIG